MIVETKTRHIERGGELPEVEFQIKNCPKAFKTIIDNLYSNKAKAVLSELSANAYDSHIEAGLQDVPFEVTMPTILDPQFTIRDFGVSMSHGFMTNGYTIAFHSEKDTSNLYNGEKGLGRLSALCLCDSYIVECYKDGTKRSYTVYLSEEGVPRIMPLGEEDTKEKDGVKLVVPVPHDKIDSFHNEASKIYSFYPVKPTFKNEINVDIEENQYVLLGDDGSWGLRGKEQNSYAIMSVYAYPINPDAITGLTDIHRHILESGAVIHFELGELHSNASREGLDYNNFTINNLKKKLDEIAEEIPDKVKVHFDGKTTFDNMFFRYDLFSNNGQLNSVAPLVKEIIKDLELPDRIIFEGCKVTALSYVYYKNKVTCSNTNRFYVDKRYKFYYCDKKSYLRQKAKKYFQQEEVRYNDDVLVFVSPEHEDAEQTFYDTYGIKISDFEKASSLPFDKPIGTTSRGKTKTLLWSHADRIAKNCWDEVELENSEKNILYVERHGYNFSGCTDNYDRRRFCEQIRRYENLTGLENVEVYGLTPRQIKKGDKSWKRFDKALEDAIRKWEAKNKENIKTYWYFRDKYESFPEDLIRRLTLEKGSLLWKAYQEFLKVKKIKNSIETMPRKVNYRNSVPYRYSTDFIKAKYPLLLCCNTYDVSKAAIEDLNEYIKNK